MKYAKASYKNKTNGQEEYSIFLSNDIKSIKDQIDLTYYDLKKVEFIDFGDSNIHLKRFSISYYNFESNGYNFDDQKNPMIFSGIDFEEYTRMDDYINKLPQDKDLIAIVTSNNDLYFTTIKLKEETISQMVEDQLGNDFTYTTIEDEEQRHLIFKNGLEWKSVSNSYNIGGNGSVNVYDKVKQTTTEVNVNIDLDR